jgi:peptide-methionine (S)-S-oxide reductase
MRITLFFLLLSSAALLLTMIGHKRVVQAAGTTTHPATLPANARQATFAAGCFWGVEETFRHVPGVLATSVGYTGGNTNNPSYKDVCTDLTGHAEAVLVTYDPDQVTYEELLDAFWSSHDPTTKDRQGPDFGTQYRSAIFYHDADQEKAAKASLKEIQDRKLFPAKVVTEIVPVGTFYNAEDYHQQYFAKNGGVCHTGIAKVTTKLAEEAKKQRESAPAAASQP